MTMLPDVPEDAYRQYQADQFTQDTSNQIDAFGFEHAANSQIASLQPPPTPPPPTLPGPSPDESLGRIGGWAQQSSSLPPATLPASAFDQPDQSQNIPTPAPAPTPDQSSPSIPGSQWLADTFGAGLNAVQQAGGNVDQFAQDFGQQASQTGQGISDVVGNAMSAASRAGADVDQFISNFQLPSLPTAPPAQQSQPAAPAAPPSPGAVPQGGDLQSYARQAAQNAGIDPDIFVRQIQQESGFNPSAKSPAGAQGIAQIVPQFHPGVDTSDPYASLDYAANLDAQNLKAVGGDYAKMLAAYNAGLGAVQKAGGVPPFEETTRYVSSILGDQNAPPSVNESLGRLGTGFQKGQYQDISQFGDRQLSADEAYAACGPAAAVRFAQMYGRNPTLREATDLAASVGWTPGSGMAGIGSEKALMDKLGVPTHIVGPNVQAIAQEASTGNPVTISTPGHYFFADGYDPNSGAFHVGQSGLDLKGGAEWMTPDQMARLMGPVQGALFADNPVVPAPSTADQTTNPAGFLDRARDTIGGFFSGLGSAVSSIPQKVTSSLDPAVVNLDDAVSGAAARQQAQLPGGAFNRLAPGSEGGPPQYTDFGQAAALATTAQSPQEAVQTTASDVGQALQDVALNGPIGAQRQVLQAVGQALQNPDVSQLLTDVATGGWQVATRDNPDIAALGDFRQQVFPTIFDPGYQQQLQLSSNAIQKLQQTGDVNSLTPDEANALETAFRTMAIGAEMPEGLSAEGLRALTAGGERLAPAVAEEAARAAGEVPRPSGAPADVPWDPTSSASAANRTVGRMLEDQLGPEQSQGTFLQQVVRAVTNRFEAADRYQQDALRNAGYTDLNKPPEQLDLSSLLRQQHGDAAAELRIQNDFKPAVQAAGDDQKALSSYLIHQNNVDVANAIGDQVMREAADQPVASSLTDALNSAKQSLRMRQQVLEELRNASVPDDARIAAQQRQVQGAQRSVNVRQAAVDAARQQILDNATAAGQDARNNRAFSGGLRVADSEQALQAMQNEMTPERFQKVQDSAQQVYAYLQGLRDTLVNSGVIDQATADQWGAQYPHWVPTRVLDYLDEGGSSGALRSGAKIGLGDSGIRDYTVEGTSKFRQNPLASIVDLTHQVETKSRRNRMANAFVELDNARPEGQQRLVKTDRPAAANQPVVQRINNGTVERYLAPPDLAAAVNGPHITQAPGFVRHWTNFVRNVTTVLSPAFALARNPSLDVPEYYTRTLGRMGGNPLLLPRLTAALARGYADAMQGLLQGEYRGELAQRYLAGGGGASGMVERSVASSERAARNLNRPTLEFNGVVPTADSLRQVGGYMLSNPSELLGAVKQLATLRPVAALAERTELGPRLAAMKLAEESGATPARAVMNGRTVTMDFNEGGTLAKTLNSFIPFFNAGVQGSAQVTRAIRENPRGFLASTGLTVGLPAIGAEIWNNSDPQRARDYADVPQYLKDQGVVVMLPGEAPVDAQGNRHPQFWWVNMRGYAPFSSAARTAAHQVLESTVGTPTPTDWQDAGRSMLVGAQPFRASSVADVPGALMPQFVPGATTGLQLSMDKDIFRNRQIATARNDQQAAQASREIAAALTGAGRMIDPSVNIRPSQVDFAVRDMLGGVGAAALGARQFLPGAEGNVQNQPQNAPISGGILQAIGVRGTGGELGTQARGNLITPDSQRWLQSQGVEWTPSPVTPVIGKVTLTADEETRYQQLANQYVEQALQDLRSSGDLNGESQATKLKLVQGTVDRARQEAAADIRDTIPEADWNRRVDAAYAAAGR